MSVPPPIFGKLSRRAGLLLALTLLELAGLVAWLQLRPPPPVVEQINRLRLGSGAPAGPLAIAINLPQELDGQARAEVFARRTAAVMQHPELVERPYAPTAIYSQIADGKPWWGLTGLYSTGPGPHGNEGLSEETRFLLNPFLLLALEENAAFGSRLPVDEARPFWPEAVDLEVRPAQRSARATIDLSGYLAFTERCGERCAPLSRRLFLVTLNAEDFGFRYLVVDPASTVSVRSPGKPLPLGQFIHTGGSCGVAGGCNNASPFSDEMVVRFGALPARLAARLFYAMPQPGQMPDLEVTLELVDRRAP